MRASVRQAWPAFCKTYEDTCSWMYLDVLGKVTTGVGFLIDSPAAAQELPWWRSGVRATDAEVAAEWQQIKARQELAPRGGRAFRQYATMHLAAADIDPLLLAKTAKFWTVLARRLPGLEAWPADAQLALMDMAWHMGPYFLGSEWPNFTAAAERADYAAMAVHCPTARRTPRDARHQKLYLNAATVEALGLDPERLWDGDTPHLEDEVTETDLAKIGKLIDQKLAALPKPPTAAEVAQEVWKSTTVDIIPSPDGSTTWTPATVLAKLLKRGA